MRVRAPEVPVRVRVLVPVAQEQARVRVRAPEVLARVRVLAPEALEQVLEPAPARVALERERARVPLAPGLAAEVPAAAAGKPGSLARLSIGSNERQAPS